MRAALLLPLLVTLAGCGLFSRAESPASESRPDYVACRREAENSQDVRSLGAQAQVDNPLNVGRVGSARDVLVNRLYRECLRRRGLALPGGVESVRNRN